MLLCIHKHIVLPSGSLQHTRPCHGQTTYCIAYVAFCTPPHDQTVRLCLQSQTQTDHSRKHCSRKLLFDSFQSSIAVFNVEKCDSRTFNLAASQGDFRPRGALPTTARCRSFDSPPILQVYWRSLFGRSELTPPYEFAFGLTNPTGPLTANSWVVTIFEGENQDFAVDASGPAGIEGFEVCDPMTNASLRREDASIISLVLSVGVDVPASFDLLLRIELRSSLSARAYLQCPDTSLWQPRENLRNHISVTAQGLPRYTTCVEEPEVSQTEEYIASAHQHNSAVLFVLPYARFYGIQAEPLGLEVRMRRVSEGHFRSTSRFSSHVFSHFRSFPACLFELWESLNQGFSVLEPSPAEAASELVNFNLEANGRRVRCGSLPLGRGARDEGVRTDLGVPSFFVSLEAVVRNATWDVPLMLTVLLIGMLVPPLGGLNRVYLEAGTRVFL